MQVHREREDRRKEKPLREMKAHFNITHHLLGVEGLDFHPTGDLVVDLVFEKHNPQLKLSS